MRCVMLVAVSAGVVLPRIASATVVTFPNDYQGFVNAAGPLTVIDFETLPDGSPSLVGTELTETFNYDAHGAHFSAPFPYPYIAGNPISGFRLKVEAPSPPPGQVTWIIADLTQPAYAVGAFFPGGETLCAFAETGEMLGCVTYNSFGGGLFVGIVSTVPIASATFAPASSDSIEAFLFSPVPEPATVLLLASALVAASCRRRRSWAARGGSAA